MKCHHNCRQGRDCPSPQACELPEDDSERGMIADLLRAMFIAVGMFIVGLILLGAL